ncbi:MAG: carboxypeptidase-like regulatory domain-containing protein, partial [Anaerolineales bacterium]
MRRISQSLSLILLIFLTGCSLLTPTPSGQITTPSSGTAAPAAEVRFIVETPQSTPNNADLDLVLLDPATDLNFNTQRIPMQAQSDGSWAVSLTPAVGSLLYYRYEKSGPSEAIEVTAQGSLVDYRNTYISGPGEIREIVARWSDEPYQAESGRLLGQVLSTQDGQPLNEMLISVGGHLTFTDGEGRYRVDDLPAGRHSITAFSPTGSYLPYRQEALIAANTTTPADIQLEAAEPVVVTIQVRVPANTPEQARLHLAGNIAQLGFRFTPSEYGSYQSISQMPTLVRVDPENYLGVFTLYSGTYLHYKYTLGDGVWNAERSASGAFAARS